MQQIKIFKGVEGELGSMQDTINSWLQESGARVLSMTGNISPQTITANNSMNTFSDSDILIVVLYETEG